MMEFNMAEFEGFLAAGRQVMVELSKQSEKQTIALERIASALEERNRPLYSEEQLNKIREENQIFLSINQAKEKERAEAIAKILAVLPALFGFSIPYSGEEGAKLNG